MKQYVQTDLEADRLIGRDFTAPAPDRRWVADFTQVATLAGMVYVSVTWNPSAEGPVGRRPSSPARIPRNTDSVDCDEGAFHRMAFVVDIFSRMFAGWAASRHKRAKLVLDVLDMALWRALSRPGPDPPL
jgi:putative transposase